MKKTFIAVAVLGALSTFALADSSVTLYGKIDLGPAVAKTKGSSAKASLDSGNYYGSRWGIRGVEDLGGGNNVGFQLEQGISADTGAAGSSRAFHRISRLYVNGGWGEVGFGRWGALSSGTGPYDMIGGAIWLGDGSTSFGATNAWDTIAANPGRMDNSIVYVSPNFGGLTIKAMYSNKEDGSSTDDSANKWSKNNHYYGIGAKYAGGGLTTVLVFEVRDRDGLDGSYGFEKGTGDRDVKFSNSIDNPIYNLNFAIGYDFGMIVPQFGYTWTKQEDVGSQHTFGLSAYSPIGAGRLTYGARYLFGSYDGLTKAAAKSYSGLGEDKYRLLTINAYYEYFLSKRTEVYAYAAWTKGSKAWSKTGLVGSLTGSNINSNGYAVQLGIVHSF